MKNPKTFEESMPILEEANRQRLASLEGALNIVSVFADPSLTPDEHDKWCDVKKALLEMYSV